MFNRVFPTLNIFRQRIFIGIVFFLSLVPCLSIAQAPPPSLQFVHLLADDGISVGSVETINQDHLGYMWFGGLEGLVQYDGYNFVTYHNKPNDPGSLSSNVVWDIVEDSKGVLWVATDGGLNRFNRDSGTFTHFKHDKNNSNSIAANITRSIAEDAEGNLWIGTFGGLSKLNADRTSFTNFRHDPNNDNSISSHEIRTVFIDRSGKTLWIGHDAHGINRFDIKTGTVQRYPYMVNEANGPNHSNLVSIFEDRDGFIWVGTDGGGIGRLNPVKNEFLHLKANKDDPNALLHKTVMGIAEDIQGNLWLATEGGLNYLNRQTLEFSRYTNNPNDKASLNSSTVRSVFVDVNHDLWVGTFPTGVNFLDTSSTVFQTYRNDPNNTNGLSQSSVLAMDEDESGILWLGTDGGGLNRFNRTTNTFTHYKHDEKNPKSISPGAILSVKHDRDGTLWLGTWHGGLNHFDPKTGTAKRYNFSLNPGSLSNNNIWALCNDQQQNLWIGTIGGGLNRYQQDTDDFVNYQKQAITNENFFLVWKVYEDHQGQIWVGANEGLGRYDRALDQFIFYRHDPKDPQSLSFDVVLDITEDSNQRLWVATRGGGLNLLDQSTGKFTHFREKDGLTDDIINSIKPDNLGNLWLGSAHGLTRFNPETKKSMLERPTVLYVSINKK